MKKTASKPSSRKIVKKPAAKAKTLAPLRSLRKPAGKAAARLLGVGEPAPFRLENTKGHAKCLVVCDHASNRVPKMLGTLGLSKKDLEKHIAWDPGTEYIGQYLSEKLDAPAIYSTYSRLVVDVNRGPANGECIREVSDHVKVPGNTDLPAAAKKQRLDEIFWPYHRALAGQLQGFRKKKIVPALVSIHSFTPEMDGYKRPWHIGVLWNREDDIALRLVKNLRDQNPGMVVGENEPYTLKSANLSKNTIGTHAESKGLPYVIVEFRQDLIATKRDALKWGKIFFDALAPILADPEIYKLHRQRQKTPLRGRTARKKTTAKKAVRKTAAKKVAGRAK